MKPRKENLNKISRMVVWESFSHPNEWLSLVSALKKSEIYIWNMENGHFKFNLSARWHFIKGSIRTEFIIKLLHLDNIIKSYFVNNFTLYNHVV